MTPDLFSPASYTFSPYAAPTLLTAIAILSFGLIVLIREWRSRVSFSFFIMTSAAGHGYSATRSCIAPGQSRRRRGRLANTSA